MNIDELTIGQAKELAEMFGQQQGTTPCPVEIGGEYLFRTVTHIDLGRVIELIGDFAVLEKASWVADTGRFHNALRDGTLSEVEPYPDGCIVNLNSVVDIAYWNHALPTEQK